MKSEDSFPDELNDEVDPNQPFGGKGKLVRKHVTRRKNASCRQLHINVNENNQRAMKNAIYQNYDQNDQQLVAICNLQAVDGTEADPAGWPSNSTTKPLIHISLLSNASYFRVYSTIRQTLLNRCFVNQYSSTNKTPNSTNNNNNLQLSNCNQYSNSFDHFLDEEIKLGQLSAKNIPKVVSLGFNVVFDIIRDSYQQNPNICIRSLESLLNILQGLKPESLKYEPSVMIDKMFDLIISLISLSYSSIDRKYNISNTVALNEGYHSKVLELAISTFISLCIARGEPSKILYCIKTLLIECNFPNNDNQIILLDNYNISHTHKSTFSIAIPEILILLKKNVCSFLLGRGNIPEWYSYGFPIKSLCETFSLSYTYHQKSLVNQPLFDFKAKPYCSTSLTFDGQYLILYRCNRIYLIGSGYNNTPIGHEVFSAPIDLTHFGHNEQQGNTTTSSSKETKCCSFGGWIGCVNGELFLQPNCSWSSNQIMHLNSRTLKVRNIIPLISNYSNKTLTERLFSGPTICATDGDYIILITALQDDYFIIRELKPFKINIDSKTLNIKEKITFSLSSEVTIRLSTVCFAFCGNSAHNFSLPAQAIQISNGTSNNQQHVENVEKSNSLKLVDTVNLCEFKNIVSILTGKDFALLLTDQGKVYYTGNSQSLGIRHIYSMGKWSLLTIPKPVKIVQIAIGHEGNHALLLSDDGTIFFAGTAKRGEDGDSAVRPCHRFNKPCRIKKFAKFDSNLNPEFIACNYGTSAIVSKAGELYLFGKDSQHTNSKGFVNLMAKDLCIKSIAMGKAHMLILCTNGVVITIGFSNKGQCGFDSKHSMDSNENTPSHKSATELNKSKLPSSFSSFGHLFGFGKTRRCSNCHNCTEAGVKCPNLKVNQLMIPDSDDPNFDETICGCTDGNSGCVYCGICTVCSQQILICSNSPERLVKERVSIISNTRENTLREATFCVEKNSDLITSSGSRLSAKLLASSLSMNDAESDYDSSSKMASMPPTILPFTQNLPIIQIAAGLHHSVLLTEAGDVYTFGSNQFGQLGHGDFNNRYIPTKIKIEFATKGCITQIATGSNHTVLLTSLGEVLTCGNVQTGQLGRSPYNSCKMDFSWNAFPGKMNQIGPEYGRIATFISASGDFTFVKYDEILLSSNLLTSAKLLVEKNNLILIPPRVNNFKDFDMLFEEKSCKHHYCRLESYNCQEQSIVFNNLNSNSLIISRVNGTCSIFNQFNNSTKSSKYINLFDIKNQMNFNLYSSIFVDKFYNNLWTFNSFRDEFARFNLIELEASQKLIRISNEKNCSGLFKFPTSFLNLYSLNTFNYCTNQYMKNIASALQPDLAVPLTECSQLRQSPQQFGIELLSFLTSLTYSHLLGISVNDKSDQFNVLSRSFLPEEYLSVCRFEDFGGGWGYPPHSVEAVRFSSDCDIILGGVGLYGGRGEYTAQLKLIDIGFEGSEVEKDGDLLTETDLIHYECLPRQKYQTFFDDAILIQANRWYVLWAAISGPSSDCGSSGQPFVCTTDQTMFHFKPSKLSNNGTDVNSGQIPVLLYKPVKSNDFYYPYNNNNISTNFSALTLDEEGMPFTISKDFALKVNSLCVDYLFDLLRFVWEKMKSLLSEEKLNEIFSTADDSDKLIDKFNYLILEIKKQIYISCFVLELIRAYVQIFLPFNEMQYSFGSRKCSNNSSGFNNNNSQFQKYLHYDYDEYQRIAHAFFTICTLLTSILLNPIELAGLIHDKLDLTNNKRLMRRKIVALVKLNNFFVDECYQTFLTCCHAFYPTNTLKWSALCELLSSAPESLMTKSTMSNESTASNSLEVVNMFDNRQLYILSALTKAFSHPSFKLISFFPINKMQICNDSMNDFDEQSSPDFPAISSNIISKKISELFNFGDLYSSKDYSCQFIFDSLLRIIVKPIRYTIQNLKVLQNEPIFLPEYQQFGNYHSENNSLNSPPSSSTLSSSFEEEISEDIGLEQSDIAYDYFAEDDLNNDRGNGSNSFDSLFKSKSASVQSKQIYTKKLVSNCCDLLLKLISELNASSIGLLNKQLNCDSQSLFFSNTEYVSPSRFCRRSSTKSWDTGSGSAEAICFSVNKPNIYISGVRAYTSSMNQLKYQLQLLDQSCDDNKMDKNNFKWRTLSSVSGVYSSEDNQNKIADFCELRFEKPVLIQSNIKYALLFKNFSISSYSGDMGLPQVRGNDDTLFTFMDCSLSKNGTNLNRGQIPQVLYYNVPSDQMKQHPNNPPSNSSNPKLPPQNFHSSLESIVSMFKCSIKQASELLRLVNNLVSQYISMNASSSSHSSSKPLAPIVVLPSMPNNSAICSDSQLLELLYSILDSVFFRRFISSFMMHLHNILLEANLSYEIILSIRSVIPLIADLNKMISQYFVHLSPTSSSFLTTSAHYLVVESDHPYRETSVTNYFVKFPSAVKWMSVEFDPKCSTAQSEDYLELYIPNDYYKQFLSVEPNDILSLYQSNNNFESDDCPFQNLTPVYRKFSGNSLNFQQQQSASLSRTSDESQQRTANSFLPTNVQKYSSNCIFIPGNELVFMLKTSSRYVHLPNSSDDLYYGFRAQVIGYNNPCNDQTAATNDKDQPNTESSNVNKETLFHLVKQKVQHFENDIVYLFGQCTNTLLNSSPQNVIFDHLNKVNSSSGPHHCSVAMKEYEDYLKQFDPQTDIDISKQIFMDNISILHKSLNFDQPLTMKMISNFDLPVANIHSFLDDFIKLKPQSSGARLALWFQSESFISPNSCIVSTVQSIDFCCQSCAQQLLETNFYRVLKLCSRCHYQLFVKTIPQTGDCGKNVPIGKKVYIKVITRDQHEEIAHDPNSCVELNIRVISPFSNGELLNEHNIGQSNSYFMKDGLYKSPLLNIISQNPYQITTKDKIRFHAITMMKAYENYSFEELRFHTHSLFKKKATVENIQLKSFENGYYFASWTPASIGCYKIQLIVDGETNDDCYVINVSDQRAEMAGNETGSKLYLSNTPLITCNDEDANYTKIKFNQHKDYESFVERISGLESNRPIIKHCIRKFICHDSAGLRIRALPSLQSEQIGIVAVSGLLTIIDQFENDDGIWVRLSNESIQAYCSSTAEVYTQQHQHQSSKDLFMNDNFDVNLNDFMATDISKTSFTPTLRTEAWALQFNRHFNRMLLISIDSEDDAVQSKYSLDNNSKSNAAVAKFEPLITPSWFQIINCGQDGHLIRNAPGLDEQSTIIGIVQLNDTVNAVEAIENEFGTWVRLSQDSLRHHISSLYKSTYFESNIIEGWMLVQSTTGLVYLRNVKLMLDDLAEKDIVSEFGLSQYSDHSSANNNNNNNNSKYNLAEMDDNIYSVQAKHAISNSAAKCIRAIFAAFVWHEGILHDVLTAASYLKFNAEVTKDFIKCFNNDEHELTDGTKTNPPIDATTTCFTEEEDPMKPTVQTNLNPEIRQIRRTNRNPQKTIFRHSVEVSQLLTFWSSDVNSNLNDLINNTKLIENNNNNNNNNINEDEMQTETTKDSIKEDLIMIPEILINLLKIWDFVSSECLNIFTDFCESNRQNNLNFRKNERSVSMERLNVNSRSNNLDVCENCCNNRISNDQLQPGGSFDSNDLNNKSVNNSSLIIRHCDCEKVKLGEHPNSSSNKAEQQQSLLKDAMISSSTKGQQTICNIQQLYCSLKSSAFYLLSLVPSNVPSLTGITISDDLIDQTLFAHCANTACDKLLLEDFQIEDGQCFQSLQQFGIQKSAYEQRLAEEKLSDLAILSLQHGDDYQHLLSPECLESWKTILETDEAKDIKVSDKPINISENRKSFKFYRSISVGLNDSPTSGYESNRTKTSKYSHLSHAGKHIKSSDTLEADGAASEKFNMPFLCKPSSRLISLVQQCKIRNSGSIDNEFLDLPADSVLNVRSSLFVRDVFRFIFSCYDIKMYSLVSKSTICATVYRALALNALNWLIINVSSSVSLHDIMWTFVHSLLPADNLNSVSESVILGCDNNVENDIEDSQSQPQQAGIPDPKVRKRKIAIWNNDDLFKKAPAASITKNSDICQHPFSSLLIAGESAECWITDGLHRFIKSISNLLPLLPIGTSLQQMAVRCFGIDFQPKDHIFLHECKVFSHISTILTRSIDSNDLNQELLEKSYSDKYRPTMGALLEMSNDVTEHFDFKTSSRQSMVSSLFDNSTETFWESGNEDRNKLKCIILGQENNPNQLLEQSQIKFVCVYIDNTRDVEYKVSQVEFKIMVEKADALKYCTDLANVNLLAGSNEVEIEKISSFEIDAKLCGWIHCELSQKQSDDICASSVKYLKIELNGPFQFLRIRQIKVLSISRCFDQSPESVTHILNQHATETDASTGEATVKNSDITNERRKLISAEFSMQIQTANCEAETLRVFRLLTSQVFGKLLSSESLSNNSHNPNSEKRSSFYQNNVNNENDLREHMVGILFSQSGKLSELQKQVCSHIVREIHFESAKVRDEWELFFSSDDYFESYMKQHRLSSSGGNFNQQQNSDDIPYDSYCFELLSLVLALSGSNIGCNYLSTQKELFYDILTLLHTSSDRVKRQILSLIRRVISSIKPEVFAHLLGVSELPNLSDIFAKTHSTNLPGSSLNLQPEDCVLSHVGVVDIFLACIAKSLNVQTKIKGANSGSRAQKMHVMALIFKENSSNYKQWWLKGSMTRQISQSIITLLKDMIGGQFGKEWSEVARNCVAEKILNLTRLSETYHQPEQCIKTPTLWLALASLCVLDEKDAEMLSTSNLSKFHDQANGNSPHIYCDNHDDGETVAFIQCNICGNLCVDCDRFLHLNTKTRSHKRHIFKEDVDSIKVDIHEGCGRAKFAWLLAVADSKMLKTMVEFRTTNLKTDNSRLNDEDNLLGQSNDYANPNQMAPYQSRSCACRFCGTMESTSWLAVGSVCNSEECQQFAGQTCTTVLECGHFCCGIVDETTCLPCLHGCSGDLKQDGDDMCMVCFSESLFAAPCVQLICNHVFHFHCIQAVLEKRWNGGRISFTFSQCPICKLSIKHAALSGLLQPIEILYEDVKRKALMRLEYECLNRCEAIVTPGGRFYNDPAGFALERYSYYLCFKCDKAYFGGEARCDLDFGNSDNFNPEELICGSCSDVTQAQICPKHGTDFLEYKCRFCCSVAVYFCFGTTHFCNACHDDFQQLVSLKDYPKCPVGPRCIPLEGDECPLHVVHPSTGEEFALGCGICRNAHTF